MPPLSCCCQSPFRARMIEYTSIRLLLLKRTTRSGSFQTTNPIPLTINSLLCCLSRCIRCITHRTRLLRGDIYTFRIRTRIQIVTTTQKIILSGNTIMRFGIGSQPRRTCPHAIAWFRTTQRSVFLNPISAAFFTFRILQMRHIDIFWIITRNTRVTI